MATVKINGVRVSIPLETLKRIAKVAAEKNMSVSEAIPLCLEEVILPTAER